MLQVAQHSSLVAGRLVLCHYHELAILVDSPIPKIGLLRSVQFDKASVIYDEMQEG
jgi:hypothetical protein